MTVHPIASKYAYPFSVSSSRFRFWLLPRLLSVIHAFLVLSCLWFSISTFRLSFQVHVPLRSYEFIFKLFLPSFLLAVLYQLLACSSWQFHDSILLVLFPTGPLGHFLCPLPLISYFGAGVRMHIC